MSGTPAVELLFGGYRRKILGLLLLREDPLHVREIGRLTGVPPGSLHRELRSLAEVGLLSRAAAGNQVRYSANKGNPIYSELAEIFRKTVGLADIIREALTPYAAEIKAAFIFGSVARAEETSSSDVDVMIVGDLPFVRAVTALAPLRERLGREINPVVIRAEDLHRKRSSGDDFICRVMNEPKLFLIGDAHDVSESAEDRALEGTSNLAR
jgi:predicted nucleotidyltransferase